MHEEVWFITGIFYILYYKFCNRYMHIDLYEQTDKTQFPTNIIYYLSDKCYSISGNVWAKLTFLRLWFFHNFTIQ